MPPRVIVFGAFDRHNLGDLLFAHVASALLPGRELVFAGLAEADLRPFGGHAVRALTQLAAEAGDRPAVLLQAGGEILTCDAWQAAVMLLPPAQLQPTIAYLAARPAERAAFVRQRLGVATLAPYVVSRAQQPWLRRIVHGGVGGIELDRADPALRAEVLVALRGADAVGVRDRRTLGHLAAAGIAASLLPDPAVQVAARFGNVIRRHAESGAVAVLRQALPQGHLAVQLSGEFGDDATLAAVARQLQAVCLPRGLGVALFRAGAAPWHDDAERLQCLAAQLPPGRVRILDSLHLWDLCALIASSRGFCGSSLHGRIVATAFGLPRLNLRAPSAAGRPGKAAAHAETWDDRSVPAEVEVGELADVLPQALAADPGRLQTQARRLVDLQAEGFAALCAALE